MLTKNEILKSPASDYMNDEQLEFFKHKLLVLKSQIEADIEHERPNLVQDERQSDLVDRAVFEENLSLSSRKIARETNLLERIKNALTQIEDKTYGYCEVTKKPIGLVRLIARPTARFSVEAKEKRESNSKLYRDAYQDDQV